MTTTGSVGLAAQVKPLTSAAKPQPKRKPPKRQPKKL